MISNPLPIRVNQCSSNRAFGTIFYENYLSLRFQVVHFRL